MNTKRTFWTENSKTPLFTVFSNPTSITVTLWLCFQTVHNLKRFILRYRSPMTWWLESAHESQPKGRLGGQNSLWYLVRSENLHSSHLSTPRTEQRVMLLKCPFISLCVGQLENQVIAPPGNQAPDSPEVTGTSYCEHCLRVTIKTSLLLSQPSALKPAGNATDRLFLATGKLPPACAELLIFTFLPWDHREGGYKRLPWFFSLQNQVPRSVLLRKPWSTGKGS